MAQIHFSSYCYCLLLIITQCSSLVYSLCSFRTIAMPFNFQPTIFSAKMQYNRPCKYSRSCYYKVNQVTTARNPQIPVFSSNTGKYGPEKTPHLDTPHAVHGIGQYNVFVSSLHEGRYSQQKKMPMEQDTKVSILTLKFVHINCFYVLAINYLLQFRPTQGYKYFESFSQFPILQLPNGSLNNYLKFEMF